MAKAGKLDFKTIRLPEYLEKEGFFSIIIGQIRISTDGVLNIPMSPAFRREYGNIAEHCIALRYTYSWLNVTSFLRLGTLV